MINNQGQGCPLADLQHLASEWASRRRGSGTYEAVEACATNQSPAALLAESVSLLRQTLRRLLGLTSALETAQEDLRLLESALQGLHDPRPLANLRGQALPHPALARVIRLEENLAESRVSLRLVVVALQEFDRRIADETPLQSSKTAGPCLDWKDPIDYLGYQWDSANQVWRFPPVLDESRLLDQSDAPSPSMPPSQEARLVALREALVSFAVSVEDALSRLRAQFDAQNAELSPSLSRQR